MIGSELNQFRITDKLGEGGMGEVYRADDTKLGRQVAIKVLPKTFVADPERLARFEREAKVLASLNHPNVAAIYDLAKYEETHFLVLELVEGEDLAERLSKGRMQPDEALPAAVQIARALETAHERGIVHRDLKPANVKLTPGGQIKVLDFGLAKAWEVGEEASGEFAVSQSPTLTAQMTAAGVLLGTAAYMSPEQAKGKAVDRRADIWSFGVVLLEMLTGRGTFRGETASETMAAVIMKDIDWDTLPEGTPAPVVSLLQRCLEKDPEKRLQAIGEARIAIENYLADPEAASAAVGAVTMAPPLPLWQRVLPWVVAAGALGLAAAAWVGRPGGSTAGREPVRLRVEVAPEEDLFVGWGSAVVFAPDGRTLAVGSGANPNQLHIRPLGQLESRPVTGSESGYQPFFSPNGDWLGFVTSTELKKVSVFGGTPLKLAEVSRNRGSTWLPDGTIVLAPNPGAPLHRMAENGGPLEPLTTLDESAGEMSHRWPQAFRGGTALVFTAGSSAGGNYSEASIKVLDLATGEQKLVHHGGTYARYVPTGHIVYAREKTLYALPFDETRLEPTGPPMPLLEGLTMSETTGGANFDFSEQGDLVYLVGDATGDLNSLLQVTAGGPVEVLADDFSAAIGQPELSPDGLRLALTVSNFVRPDVWIWDLERNVRTRLTFSEDSWQGIFSPDGSTVVFSSARDGDQGLYSKAADGSGAAQRLLELNALQVADSFSPDGSRLAFSTVDNGNWDVAVLDLASGEFERFAESEFDERNAMFSPDGQWIAYDSTESGEPQIYVRPYPGPGGKWQVSTDWARQPRWSADGRELYYRSRDGVMKVQVGTQGTSLVVGNPELAVESDQFDSAFMGDWTMTPDAQRFILLGNREGTETGPDMRHANFVLNWFEELRQLGRRP